MGHDARRSGLEVLGPLLREVGRARASLAAVRTSGSPERTRHARSELFDALTAYTGELTTRGLPVPYAIRDELWLLQHVPW